MELGQQLVDHNVRFWDAAAAVLQAALAQPAHLTDSIEALDAWSVDTGKHPALALWPCLAMLPGLSRLGRLQLQT